MSSTLTLPSHDAMGKEESPTGSRQPPQRVKVNLTNGQYLTRSDHKYLSASRDGNECGARCPRHPHYRCTRDRGHGERSKNNSPDDLDHAAHGWLERSARRLIVMYARWSQ